MCTILKRFLIAGLALTGFGLVNVYAETRMFSDPWMALRRMGGWENPITGQHISLSSFYRYSTIRSGLSWKVYLFANNKSKGLDEKKLKEFDFFIIRMLNQEGVQTKILEEYELEPDGEKKNICGQKILQGRAFNKQGKPYKFSQLETVFGAGHKKYNVLFIHDIAEEYAPWPTKVFCPIVQSFYNRKNDDNPLMIDNQYLWYNPLSAKSLSELGDGIKIRVEDIIAHRLGTYQAYKVTKDKLHSDIIKITGDPYFVDIYNPVDIEDLHLRDGTVVHWKKRNEKVNSYRKYEGSFAQTEVKNEKRVGFIYGTITQYGVVLVKAWRDDGQPLAEDDRAFVQKLFENSVPD